MSEPEPDRPRAVDYTLLVPDTWRRINLDTPEADIQRIVEERFRGIDNAPHIKNRLGQSLLDQARQAYAAGGIEIYISTQAVGPVPLAASLVVTAIAPEPGGYAVSTSETAASLTEDGWDATAVELPCGPAIRMLSQHSVPSPDDPVPATVTNLTVHCAVPGGGYLSLAFSTPLTMLAEAMVGLFDAISRTARWL